MNRRIFGIPPAGLVAEMDAGLEQVLQLGLCHAWCDVPSDLGLIVHRVHLPLRPPQGHPDGIQRCASRDPAVVRSRADGSDSGRS